MNTDMKSDLNDIFSGVKTVGITGHVRPDGDCVGSTLGLYNYIKENFPEVTAQVYLQYVPSEFEFLKYSDAVKTEADESIIYDVFFILDCGVYDRFEPFKGMFDNAKKRVCIDHHGSSTPIADVNYIVPEYSSCSELVFNCMDSDKISKNAAECLYVGIIHDTGVLKYQSTTKDTMIAAGELMSKGIDFTSIIDNTFYSRTYRQSQALGKAFLESVLFYDGKCVFSVFSKADMEFYGVNSNDLGGIVEQLRLNQNVEVAIFLYELNKNEYKVSMRSKNMVDVAKIAQFFGGGGHMRAAGFTMVAHNPRDIINNIGAQLEKQF